MVCLLPCSAVARCHTDTSAVCGAPSADCTAMLYFRLLWASMFSDPGVGHLSVYLFTDASPQWRGLELYASTIEMFDGGTFLRRLLPMISLDRYGRAGQVPRHPLAVLVDGGAGVPHLQGHVLEIPLDYNRPVRGESPQMANKWQTPDRLGRCWPSLGPIWDKLWPAWANMGPSLGHSWPTLVEVRRGWGHVGQIWPQHCPSSSGRVWPFSSLPELFSTFTGQLLEHIGARRVCLEHLRGSLLISLPAPALTGPPT